MTQPVAPPQLSPDGHWWWDGTEWVPAAQRPAVPEQPQPQPQPQPEPQQEAQPAPAPVLPGYAEPVTITPTFAAAPTFQVGAAAPAPSQHDGMAIASLVLSVLWMVGLGSVGGVVLGHLSRSKAKREGRQPSGLALAGLILGYAGAAFMVAMILAAIAIPVFLNQRVKGNDAIVRSDLRNAATAEEMYMTDRGAYTADVTTLQSVGFVPDRRVEVQVFRADSTGYCIGGHLDTSTFYFDSTNGGLTQAPCS